jgi:C-terminal processing protease CtpA/Prc
MHEGFAPETGRTSGGYASYTRTREQDTIQPTGRTNTGPVVFLASPGGTVPAFALALQRAGRGVVIQEGSEGAVQTSAPTHAVQLSDGLVAEVRTGRLVFKDGTYPSGAALTMPRSTDTTDAVLDRALAIARGDVAVPTTEPAAVAPSSGATSAYTNDAYPSAGERVLAVARAWSIIEHFFPYKDLMDAPWREALPTAVESALEAEDAEAYHLAIARLMVQTDDSHVAARSAVLDRVLGAAPPPVQVRMIEGEPVVTRIVDDTVADTSGIERGHVVLAVDGVPAKARLDSLDRYLRAASTPQARDFRSAFQLLWGDEGRAAMVRVRGADGTERTVELPRGSFPLWTWRDGPVMQRLTDRIGYADLDRLEQAQVDSMFARFADTDAIIFDMRGYPNGTAWSVAPRLAEAEQPIAASFAKPLRLGLGERDRQTIDFDQRIPPRRGARYTGKTVMLIDERAISQAEHTGLFLKAANGTTLIGSPTNGANGDVTQFRLPGRIRVTFTGQSVRHPDGTQLQRRGLQPDIAVRPTIDDIRRGRDAVLQTAIDYLQEELGATEP